MPLLWVSLAFCAGIFIASFISLPTWLWGIIGLPIIVFAYLEIRFFAHQIFLSTIRSRLKTTLSVIFLAFILGALRFTLEVKEPEASDLSFYNGHNVQVSGEITAYPDIRDHNSLLLLKARKLCINQVCRPIEGKMILRTSRDQDWEFGDSVRVAGLLQIPPDEEGFSYRDYLARKGVYSLMDSDEVIWVDNREYFPVSWIYRLRKWSYQTINTLLPQPEAGLLNGILLGIERDISPGLEKDFQTTGIAHIVVISGFNIIIISNLFTSIALRLFPRRWATWIAISGICLYSLMVGGQPPVVRAAIMGSMGLIARQIGRRQTVINSLVFSAALMTLFNPHMLWNISFQLSFMATLGLIAYSESFSNRFLQFILKYTSEENAERITFWVSEYFLVTIAAQITTFPVLFHYFQRISIISLAANILILPVQPLIMILGGLMTITGLIFLPLGKLFSVFTWPLLAYTLRMTEMMANIPHGNWESNTFPLWCLLLYYAFLAIVFFRKYIPKKVFGWLRPGTMLAILVMISTVVWQGVLHSRNELMHFSIYHLPDEMAYLVQTAEGQNILINGGQHPREIRETIGKTMPLLDRNLDLLIILDQKPSSLPGFEDILQQYPARWIWHQAYASIPDSPGSTIEPIKADQALALSGEMIIEILAEDPRHTAIIIRWKKINIIIPDGIDPESINFENPGKINQAIWILERSDLEQRDIQVWQQYSPLLVIFENNTGLSTNQKPLNWVEAKENEGLTLISNGEKLWIKRIE